MGAVVLALVTIAIHNQAELGADTVQRAQAEVERLCPLLLGAPVSWGHSTFHVVLRRQPGGGPGSASASALGTTVGDDHAEGGTAFVFVDRVLRLAHQYQQPVHVVLALAIAHEIGHLLLPAPAHAREGLMKASWDGDDIRRLVQAR